MDIRSRATITYALILIGIGLFIGCAMLQQQMWKPTEGDIIFSHKRHAAMDIECEYCHVDTATSEFAVDNTLPREQDCMRCHTRTQGCELCHRDVKQAIHLTQAAYRTRFSHRLHLTLERVEPLVCVTCHEAIAESAHVSDTDPPRMRVCLSCHDLTEEDCTTCHGQMSTDINFVPASHDVTWLERHRVQAPQDDELCADCHRGKIRPTVNVIQVVDPGHSRIAQSRFCADCHRGDIWPEEAHDNNYLQTHRFDASADSDTCLTCHSRLECQSCHMDNGFTYEMVHPSGFIFQHGDEAKRELTNCVTCHQEVDCLGCHSAISPHPPGWERDINANNRELCLKCHIEGEL